MGILINVVNQKMYMSSTMDGIVAGSQQFVKFRFNLTEEWDGLLTFAQFRQSGKAYNQYLDDENCVYLPPEIGVGTCTLMLYGSHETTIGTTNYRGTQKVSKRCKLERKRTKIYTKRNCGDKQCSKFIIERQSS